MATGETINYQGNPALAQGTPQGAGPVGVIPPMTATLDALDKMRMYQFYENRDKWVRMNVLADRDAKDAAELLKFPMGDWLPQDASLVQSNISDAYKEYVKDPTAVNMRMDPKTGEWINREAYERLHGAIDLVNLNTKLANTRKQGQVNLALQGAAILDQNQHAKFEEFYDAAVVKSGINDPINMYPNLAVHDYHDVKGPDLDPEFTRHLGNYFINAKYKATLIQNGVNDWLVKMDQDETWRNDLNGTFAKWEQLRSDAVATLTPAEVTAKDMTKLRAALQKTEAGRAFLSMYNVDEDYVTNYYNPMVKDPNNDRLGLANKDAQGVAQGEPPISLFDPLTTEEGLRIHVTNNAQRNVTTAETPNNIPLLEDEMRLRWAQLDAEKDKLARGEKATEEQENSWGAMYLQYSQALFNPQPGTASTFQNMLADRIQNKHTVRDANGNVIDEKITYSGGMGMHPGGLAMGNGRGQIPANTPVYDIAIDPQLQNAFRRESGEKSTQRVLDANGQWSTQTVSIGDYPITQAKLVQVDPNDANKNIIVVQRKNPNTGSTFSEWYNKDKFLSFGLQMFNDGRSGSDKIVLGAGAGYQRLLKNANRSSPNFQSAAPLTPGGWQPYKSKVPGKPPLFINTDDPQAGYMTEAEMNDYKRTHP